MKRWHLKTLRISTSILVLIGLTIFAFGQSGQIVPTKDDPDLVRIIGWISIVIAAVTHTSMNIYNMVRGKNYESIKEALANYRGLAESQRAQLEHFRAENIRLETENERLAEKVLRK